MKPLRIWTRKKKKTIAEEVIYVEVEEGVMIRGSSF